MKTAVVEMVRLIIHAYYALHRLHALHSKSSEELTMDAFVSRLLSQILLFFANFHILKRADEFSFLCNLSSGWQSISIQVAQIIRVECIPRNGNIE